MRGGGGWGRKAERGERGGAGTPHLGSMSLQVMHIEIFPDRKDSNRILLSRSAQQFASVQFP